MPAYKEKNGTWFCQFYYEDWQGQKQRKKKRGFATKKEALAWESEFKSMQGVELDLPFSQFVEIYFRDKEPSLKARTVINKRYTINSHVLPFFGEKRMNEILPSDVIKWQNEMQKKGFAETYLRMIRNQLTAIFTHATRVYDLRRNPCSKVKKMGKRDAEGIDFWTVDEYRQFIAQFEPGSMYHTLFEVLFWTGTRISEALAITKGDIDLEKKQLNIGKTYYRLKGEHVMARPKTENSIRSIELPMFLIREITGFTDQLYKLPDNERIFRISAEAVQHMMKRRTKKAGVKKIRVHDLRHSHVAYLIDQGVEALIIKERLGHKDIGITLNTYGHLYPSRQREIAELLDRNNS